MTLCEKLEELGYECQNLWFKYFKYYYDIDVEVCIKLDSIGEEIETYGVCEDGSGLFLYKQKEIDNMQIAFNRVQKDIKEVEKWLKMKAKLTK